MSGTLSTSARAGLLLVALLLAAGCGKDTAPLPQTYPVNGKLVVKGGPALTGGTVEFQSQTEPSLMIRGEIKPDATFTLTTRTVAGKEVPGAPEGRYRVTVFPPMTQDQTVGPIQVEEVYAVKAQDNNAFTIPIAQPRR
jgi:hypothetical protein